MLAAFWGLSPSFRKAPASRRRDFTGLAQLFYLSGQDTFLCEQEAGNARLTLLDPYKADIDPTLRSYLTNTSLRLRFHHALLSCTPLTCDQSHNSQTRGISHPSGS